MSTVTAIAEGIRAVLAGLSWVDAASIDDFLPAATAPTVAAFVVPFEQTSAVLVDSLSAGEITLIHTLTVEFWIQHRNGFAAETMQRARDAGTLAIAALLAHDGDGYTVAREYQFEERITPQFVSHLNVPWLITTLRVPVENEVIT